MSTRKERPDPHAILDELLPAAVREATGRSDVEPRPGQLALSHEALDRMLAVGQPSRSASDVATQSLSGAPTGSGKALALDTPIPTPTGWTTMGELEVGDLVLDHAGDATRVSGVSDVHTDRDCFEVVLEGRSPIVADTDHLWPVWTDGPDLRGLDVLGRLASDLGVDRDQMTAEQAVGMLHEQQSLPGRPYRTMTTARLAEVLAVGAAVSGLAVSPDGDPVTLTYASVRPVPSVPVRCIMVEAPSRLFLAGPDLVATHNSLAYLAPLFLDSALHNRRGVVSTESLSLQSQIIDKDAPAVAKAIAKTLGLDVTPSFAILKGWSNFGCVSRAVGTAAQALGLPEEGQGINSLPNLAGTLNHLIARDDGDVIVVDDEEFESSRLLPLVKWILDEAQSPDGTGDRDTYPGDRTPQDWRQVSVTPDDCVGVDRCPFADVCLPHQAHQAASVADVVVTNHAMLAVQAANNVPVVLGNGKLGIFDHLVIDEAHALPAIVRGAGARSISAPRVMSLVRLLHKNCATEESRTRTEKLDKTAQHLVELGERLAMSLDRHLDRKVAKERAKSRHGSAVVGLTAEDEEPLGPLGDQLHAWAKQVSKALPADNPSAPLPPTQAIKLRRARADVDRFSADLKSVLEHQVGYARWVADGDPTRAGRWVGASLRASPVDVSGPISQNLFTSDVVRDRDDDSAPWGQVPEHRWVSDEDAAAKRPPRYRLSATAVSATLPKSFAFDTGMAVKAKEYPSPFGDAFAGSALFIPLVTDFREAAGFTRTWPGSDRASFDTKRHPDWAAGKIVELVRANGGRALVLAATVAAGQQYATTLRAVMPGVKVFSQWDGRPVRHLLAEWRADETSVMVGTKSLMTGVDAPGQTCSLVILDRVPRDAGNPVDDARLEAVMERGNMSRWAADRYVYVADADLRLAQAEGRLIRAAADRGMVAILDPRLLKKGVVTYPEPTRELLMGSLRKYGTKISDLQSALAWLRAHRTSVDTLGAAS